ncbi:MAG TPA: DMT family transporter [Novimethylophilus sp.]|jgi:drug/metabolite transporter (DMT)-like permease|uniref:DMT family transporter n=1 Tax=Novimethylophilus sp. TaxID=2137426 RepID=UPI002F41FD37
MTHTTKNPAFSTLGLLSGAVVWGLIWYPYRLLEQAGVSGIQSSLLTYGMALILGAVLFARHWRDLARVPREAIWIGLAAGWTNLGYVLAILEGEVMRVLLLFYLAPLWTLLLARLLLDEKVGPRGLAIMALSLAGMFTMLWQGRGWPLPQNGAEWIALSAGVGFAATNVLTRRAGQLTLKAKSLSVWAGVCAIALVFFLFERQPMPAVSTLSPASWMLMTAMGVALAATTWMVQFGVTHTPANKAAVIFMFELVVAAISSYLLAGEEMTAREWAGGAMIVLAALYSGRIGENNG